MTLTDATGGKIPLPSRRYFKLHDACAKIFHLSGAGDVVEQVFRDIQNVNVLAEDGGSHNLVLGTFIILTIIIKEEFHASPLSTIFQAVPFNTKWNAQ